MFLLVPAYPGCPGSKAVKRSLLLLLYVRPRERMQYSVVQNSKCTFTHTHTRLTALFPGLPGWAGTRKVKTNLDFTEARDSEWQWHQLGRMQVCTSLQTDSHASTPPLSFFTGRMSFLPPSQQCQSTEGILKQKIRKLLT